MVRKTIEEQKAALEEKKAQIEARLKNLSASEARDRKKREDRQKIVLGALVLGAAQSSTRHRDFALSILRNAPARPQDEAVIAALITLLDVAISPPPPVAQREGIE